MIKKKAILDKKLSNLSNRKIGKLVGCSHQTVADFLIRHLNSEIKFRTGRKPLLDDSAREKLKNFVKNGNRRLIRCSLHKMERRGKSSYIFPYHSLKLE
jgi:hypothetical protein